MCVCASNTLHASVHARTCVDMHMLCCVVLCCAVLCCDVLCCAVLCCVVLCCVVFIYICSRKNKSKRRIGVAFYGDDEILYVGDVGADEDLKALNQCITLA